MTSFKQFQNAQKHNKGQVTIQPIVRFKLQVLASTLFSNQSAPSLPKKKLQKNRLPSVNKKKKPPSLSNHSIFWLLAAENGCQLACVWLNIHIIGYVLVISLLECDDSISYPGYIG
jgi:hypothetical protein